MNKDSKIYLAGHDGLVGSAIYRELVNSGYSNIITKKFSELDLRDQAAVKDFFNEERPEYVFLAAAKVGGIAANSKYKAEFIYDNIMIAANVIHSSWEFGVKKLVNLGSSCIYPKLAPQPLKEDYLLSGFLEPTNDAYALAKIAAIKMCVSFNEQYNTNFISAMPTNLYGPGDNFNMETSHVLPALLRKMHLGKIIENGNSDLLRKDLDKYPVNGVNGSSGEKVILEVLEKFGITENPGGVEITLWGDGTPLREFLYSEDLAGAVIFLMNSVDAQDMSNGFINVGVGKDLTIKELAFMIKDITGFSGKIKWDSSKPNGTMRKLLDVSEITGHGWKPQIGLEDGIKRMYDWYKS